MEKPTYYTILPPEVRFDKRLTPLAKIMLSEITALGTNGTCWASNEFFIELYDINERTVARTIKLLIDCGYLSKKIDNGKRILTADKNVTPSRQKCPPEADKNVTQNNTRLSIQDNNIYIPVEKEEKEERENADYDYFVKSWNEAIVINCPGISKIATFSDERKKKLDELVATVKPAMKTLKSKETKPERFILKTLQKEYGLSDYLSGKSKKGAVGVDFVLTTEYFMKLLEGFYRTEQN